MHARGWCHQERYLGNTLLAGGQCITSLALLLYTSPLAHPRFAPTQPILSKDRVLRPTRPFTGWLSTFCRAPREPSSSWARAVQEEDGRASLALSPGFIRNRL